jgi:hypothetical protein
LQDKHKDFLINFFDEHSQASTSDAVDSLTKQFEKFSLKDTVVGDFLLHECNLTMKKATLHPAARNDRDTFEKRLHWVKQWAETDMNFLTNCVFIDKSGFNINMRSVTARSTRGKPAIVITPITKVVSHSVLGAISAFGILSVEIRIPHSFKKRKVDSDLKRKAGGSKQAAPKGTTTVHYLKFISNTLDVMDSQPEMILSYHG